MLLKFFSVCYVYTYIYTRDYFFSSSFQIVLFKPYFTFGSKLFGVGGLVWFFGGSFSAWF